MSISEESTMACKITRYAATAMAIALLAVLAAPGQAQAAAAVVPIYRMYNAKTSEHLYTLNIGEYDACGRGAYADWRPEGVGWYAPKTSKTPVYRLYNRKSGDHHYTTSAGERDILVAQHGWTSEGIAFYSDDAKSLPLYRVYNGRLKRGQHHYTASTRERDVLSSSWGWAREGIGFYGAKASSSSFSQPTQRKWVVDKSAWDEPVYESVWVQDSAAWDEPTYTTKSYYLMSDGAKFYDDGEAYAYQEQKALEGNGVYVSVQYEQVQTGTIHHEATGHYEPGADRHDPPRGHRPLRAAPDRHDPPRRGRPLGVATGNSVKQMRGDDMTTATEIEAMAMAVATVPEDQLMQLKDNTGKVLFEGTLEECQAMQRKHKRRAKTKRTLKTVGGGVLGLLLYVLKLAWALFELGARAIVGMFGWTFRMIMTAFFLRGPQ